MVKTFPVPPGKSLSTNDLERMVAEISNAKDLRTMLPGNATFLSGGPIRLDGRPGFYQTFTDKQQQLDIVFSSISVAYTVYYQTWAIQILCSSAAEVKEERLLKARFEKFEPLFKMVANSFVILSQWQ